MKKLSTGTVVTFYVSARGTARCVDARKLCKKKENASLFKATAVIHASPHSPGVKL